jgi:hypothetical protein
MSVQMGIVKYFGFSEKDSCGYCQSDTPNFNTHGI